MTTSAENRATYNYLSDCEVSRISDSEIEISVRLGQPHTIRFSIDSDGRADLDETDLDAFFLRDDVSLSRIERGEFTCHMQSVAESMNSK